MQNEKVFLYDTTLRDGAQGEGISFADSGKIHLAHLLDDMGVDFIEGGFASSNPRDQRFFSAIRNEKLRHAQITAFGSTRRADLDAARDPQLAALMETGAQHITLFGKTSLLHVAEILRTTPENNLQIIADSIGHLHQNHHRTVFFDAEHFFDGYKEDATYALRVLATARRAGAHTLILCDTNGGTLPHEIHAITQSVRAAFAADPALTLGIHTHNDGGLATANSLEAVRAGARHVQGTINGYGERTGNADLVSIIPALELKMGFQTVGATRLRGLRALSAQTADLANQTPDKRQPYVGQNAFCHKAGAHVNAVGKLPRSFEHIEPGLVGNQRRILVSELAGTTNIELKAKELGVDLAGAGKDKLRAMRDTLKERENQGYAYESAEGSFKLLLQKILSGQAPHFEFQSFRVIVEKRGPGEPCLSEATVKIKARGKTRLTAGEGRGPVDALHAALTAALADLHPQIAGVTLTDYRVRILNPEAATRALTRVLVESGDGTGTWSTVGVSENIIEASWQALLDSIECKLHAQARDGDR
ncbi:MAG: citramalate synthase [Puniceicoccales bacterium]|jgi:2-isopropylmalate synthase|nr:citramalate synthase [Puniceicoccales bacterium]